MFHIFSSMFALFMHYVLKHTTKTTDRVLRLHQFAKYKIKHANVIHLERFHNVSIVLDHSFHYSLHELFGKQGRIGMLDMQVAHWETLLTWGKLCTKIFLGIICELIQTISSRKYLLYHSLLQIFTHWLIILTKYSFNLNETFHKSKFFCEI